MKVKSDNLTHVIDHASDMSPEERLAFAPSVQASDRMNAKERIAAILDSADRAGAATVIEVQRMLAKCDLWYLLLCVLSHPPRTDSDWVFERCREVQLAPDGYLDLWAREHYKSTIITYALSIQDILNNPNETIGIFSFSRPVAKAFLSQIKRELEGNDLLKNLFPDILYKNPSVQSQRWSEDFGLIVKRDGNPKEATVEAWGLVDSQPTSKHFGLMVYDDVITIQSVSTTDMINKVTSAWEISQALGSQGGRVRYIGTRYDYNDTYKVMIERGAAIPRIHPAEENGKAVFLSDAEIVSKRKTFGAFNYASQMLLNPISGSSKSFREEWIRFWDANNRANLNIYVAVDPATSKKKDSDYTVIMVIGIGEDENYYVLDITMDRFNMGERANALMSVVREYKPLCVGYERYGMQMDVEYMMEIQKRQNFRFPIVELMGRTSKEDRIKALAPLFESGRIYIPRYLSKMTNDGTVDIIAAFMEQYKTFPYCRGHDDLLDCLANIGRMNMVPPMRNISRGQDYALVDSDLYGLTPKPQMRRQGRADRSEWEGTL